MGVALGAADFIPPEEGPVPFRRDKIPLNVEEMMWLSHQLDEMARGWNPTTDVHRRAAAQMLALALALDPANANARNLVSEYEQNHHQAPGDRASREPQPERMLADMKWLESEPAGHDGHALAACLKDILTLTDPKRSEPGEWRESDELGAWTGWIPTIADYHDRRMAATPATPETAPESPPAPAPAPVAKREILLRVAQVHTLFWRPPGKSASANWVLAPARLEMTASQSDEPPKTITPFRLVIGTSQAAGHFAQMSVALCHLLQKTHAPLPTGTRISITTSPDLDQALPSHPPPSISAAAAVLASAALTGCQPEAIIIGQLDETGTFRLPPDVWKQLQSLGKGNGQRLVMPSEAAPFLEALLAMENPEFFLQYEVLLASNFNQLLDLTAKTPGPGHAKSSHSFHEICSKLGSQNVRPYIANRFVRQRLAEILQESPCHYSAKMLLVQSSGTRPTHVPRMVVAAELRRALEPINPIVEMANLIRAPWRANPDNKIAPNKLGVYEFSPSDVAKFGPASDLSRSLIDGLERYTEKNDRDLLDRVRKIHGAIRSLERATRTRGYPYEVIEAVRVACDDLLALHKEMSAMLAREAGEAPPSLPL